ncbi:MAG: diaminopimelate epimerase [Phycisphaerales bacterium]
MSGVIGFVKMQGIGNDYVYVDEAAFPVADPPSLARRVSDRHFGIGSDGLIMVGPPSPGVDADVRMRMYNADGSEGLMCGNGIRCVAKFAVDGGLSQARPLRVETRRGVLAVEWRRGPDGQVQSASVQMGEPILAVERIPALVPGVEPGSPAVERGLPATFFGSAEGPWRSAAGLQPCFTLVSMGNPHMVMWVRDVHAVPLESAGAAAEHHAWFPQRINVHFVQVISGREVRMRTWERGSGATMACGTGASAVCVAGVLGGRTGSDLLAHLPGGDLELSWPGAGRSVRMTGPAVEVFRGEIRVAAGTGVPA